MRWIVVISKSSQKFLQKISQKDATRIKSAMKEVEEDPFSGDISKLTDENEFRRRVGNYRIFFEVYRERIFVWVTDIRRRTSKTYRR